MPTPTSHRRMSCLAGGPIASSPLGIGLNVYGSTVVAWARLRRASAPVVV